jgi:hypothetical protein
VGEACSTCDQKVRSAYTSFVGKLKGHASLKDLDRCDTKTKINGYLGLVWTYMNIERIL